MRWCDRWVGQSHGLGWAVEMLRRPTPTEVVADLDADVARRPQLKVDTDSLLADRDSGRP
jgi:hypothetical protein